MSRLLHASEEHQATPAPPAPDEPTLAELAGTLADAQQPAARRLAAARALREHGPAAAEALTAALADPDVAVRLAAAEALGEVGDARAAPALVAALRALFPGGSARRFRWAARLLLVTGILAVISVAAVMVATGEGFGGLVLALLGGLGAVFGGRGSGPSLSECCRVIADALVRLAERHPAPQLLAATASLREIAADTLQQEAAARDACRAAADRIETLAGAARDLPVSAASVPVEGAVLPRAAEPPGEETAELPRPASGDGPPGAA